MRLYEIIGSEDSELNGSVFGSFTTKELAEAGYKALPEEIADETEVWQSNLHINSIETDGKVISMTTSKSAKDILALANENNIVEGYVEVSLNEIIESIEDDSADGFVNLLSEKLVDSTLLFDLHYEIVEFKPNNILVFKVTGDASEIIEK